LASHHPLSIHFHLFLSLFSTRLKRARNSRITRHTHSTSLSLIFYLTVIIIPHHRIRKTSWKRDWRIWMEYGICSSQSRFVPYLRVRPYTSQMDRLKMMLTGTASIITFLLLLLVAQPTDVHLNTYTRHQHQICMMMIISSATERLQPVIWLCGFYSIRHFLGFWFFGVSSGRFRPQDKKKKNSYIVGKYL
jgi:hypothetical protein